MSREVVIVAYGRSAVCKSRKGSFAGTHPIEYSAQVLKGVLDKVPQLDRSEIEDVIMGCAVQHGTTSMNIAKSVCARAELPECVAGHTINRFCSSGLQAIATGANAIACGQGDVIVAGGVESMTDTYAPYPVEFQDAWLNEHAPGAYMGMGMTAENIVKNYGVTREEMDRMAYESNMKAAKAQKEGKLAPSIIPVTVVDKDGNEKVAENTSENRFADNNGRQTDNDSTTSHIDIRKSLILSQQGAGKCYKAIGNHQAKYFIEVRIDSLSPCHIAVAACCTN